MVKNGAPGRNLKMDISQEIYQLLNRIRPKETPARSQSSMPEGQTEITAVNLANISDEEYEAAMLETGVQSLAKLAELSAMTELWLERLGDVRSRVAAQLRELERVQEAVKSAAAARDQALREGESARQRIEAEMVAALESQRRQREIHERENQEYREKLKGLRDQNEKSMELDRRKAQEQFILQMKAYERESLEKLATLEDELNRRDADLKKREDEWSQTMQEFEKLTLRLSKRPVPAIEHAGETTRSLEDSHPPKAAEPLKGTGTDLRAAGQSSHAKRVVEAARPKTESISELASTITVRTTAPEIEVEPELPPAATEAQSPQWNLADALAPSSPIAASGAVVDTIVGLLSREDEAGGNSKSRGLTRTPQEGNSPAYHAILDTIFDEVPGDEGNNVKSVSREEKRPVSSGITFSRNSAVQTIDISPETDEGLNPSGTLLGKFKRKVKTLKPGPERDE